MLELADKNIKSHLNCIQSIQKAGERTEQGNKRHGRGKKKKGPKSNF